MTHSRPIRRGTIGIIGVLAMAIASAMTRGAQPSVFNVDAPGTIADAGPGGIPTTNIFTFTVSNLTSVSDVDLRISIQHTAVVDLTVKLRSAAGTEITLFRDALNGNGIGQNFQDTYLDDDAGTGRIGTTGFDVAPFAGPEYSGGRRYLPKTAQDSLASFDGQNPNGTWTLLVVDEIPADTGFLFKAGDTAPWGSALGAQLIITEAEPPTLTIIRSNANLIVSWPSPAPGFALQENLNLSLTNGWTNVAAAAATNAGKISVTLPSQAGNHFFRLHK
jgi:subtilisin-like proprotein convertase family protein